MKMTPMAMVMMTTVVKMLGCAGVGLFPNTRVAALNKTLLVHYSVFPYFSFLPFADGPVLGREKEQH